jgi:hypothetical protein
MTRSKKKRLLNGLKILKRDPSQQVKRVKKKANHQQHQLNHQRKLSAKMMRLIK